MDTNPVFDPDSENGRNDNTAAPPSPPTQEGRPARALIGWLSQSEARLTLAGRRFNVMDTAIDIRVSGARASVAARQPGITQTGLVLTPPAELGEYIDRLQTTQPAQAMFNEGWQVQTVDLEQVVPVQPVIYTDSGQERIAGAIAGDLVSIAGVSLPISGPSTLPGAFDPARNAWTFCSRNPNLRIIGQCSGQEPGGNHFFGFVVALPTSFMQVGILHGRHVLRDGSHRALALLRNGIKRAPAFVRTFNSVEELALPAGMLPLDAIFGDRPPRIVDFFDDSVAADITLPATQKVIILQGLEVTPIG